MSNDNAEPTTPPAYGPSSTAAEPTPAAPQPYGQQPYGQQPYAAQPYGQQPYGYGVPALPRGLSITALICGIAGAFFSIFVFGFGLLPGLAGVIFGHMAKKREPHARGMWLTGLITGYVGVGIALLWGIFFLLMTLLPLLFIVPASLS